MALGRIKTGMHGTGGGRWGPRADIKHAADRQRRREDFEAVCERIIEANAGVLRRLAGVDDVVEHVCPDCQFEDRNGHAPGCDRG